MENAIRLKELLELVRERLIEGDSEYQTGICCVIMIMYFDDEINFDDNKLLKDYIYSNAPSKNNKYAEFINNEYWIYNSADTFTYWWSPIKYENETKEIRINYLTALINNIT